MISDDADGSPEASRWEEALRDTGAGAAGALIGAAIAGTEGAVVGGFSAPALEHAVKWIGDRWRRQSLTSGTQVLADAATAAGQQPDELAQRLAEDPKRLQLAGLTLAAATMTTDQDKLRALARALAAGANDDALVDPEMLAVAALTDMEAPHVKVLQHLADGAPRDPVGGRAWHRSVTVKHLPFALPEMASVIGPVLSTLLRHALIEEESDLAKALDKRDQDRERRRSSTWKAPAVKVRVTDFGQHCLDLLQAVADQERQPPAQDAPDATSEADPAAPHGKP